MFKTALFFAILVLFSGLGSAAEQVPLTANKLVIDPSGIPIELIFDPDLQGNGLAIAIDNRIPLPVTCLYGGRLAVSDDPTVSKAILEVRKQAELSVGQIVSRIGVCRIAEDVRDFFDFPASAGPVTLPWRSLWGERRQVMLWYSVSGSTLILLGFESDPGRSHAGALSERVSYAMVAR